MHFPRARFATWVEKLLKMAIDMGLQMNYNTEATMLTEAEDGSFTISTKDGRASIFLLHQQCNTTFPDSYFASNPLLQSES